MWQRHKGKWHFIHRDTKRVLATLVPVGDRLYRVRWEDGKETDILNMARARDAVLGRFASQ